MMQEIEHLVYSEASPVGEKTGVAQQLLEQSDKFDHLLPLFSQSKKFVERFWSARQKAKPGLCEQMAIPMVQSPINIRHIYDNLNLLHQLQPEIPIEEILKNLSSALESRVLRGTGLRSWTPEKIELLIEEELTSEGATALALEGYKEALFNSPRSIESAIDLFYNTAFAMVKTQNEAVREELFSILTLEKPWFNESSIAFLYLNSGGLGPRDETVIRESAINRALYYVSFYLDARSNGNFKVTLPERYLRRREKIREFNTHIERLTPAQLKVATSLTRSLFSKNPQRTRFLMENLKKANNLLPDILEEHELLINAESYISLYEQHMSIRKIYETFKTPSGLSINDPNEPLVLAALELYTKFAFTTGFESLTKKETEAGYRDLTPIPIEIPNGLRLKILASNVSSNEQSNEIIREVRETILTGKCPNPKRILYCPHDRVIEVAESTLRIATGPFDSNRDIIFGLFTAPQEDEYGILTSILEYHRPLLSFDELRTIEKHKTALINEIKNKFTKGIGKRGYEVLIADPELKRLGYRSIIFKSEQSGNTAVTIDIDHQQYHFTIGQNYQVVFGKDVKKFNSHQDQLWLELLVLSHLKKVMCTEEDQMPNELTCGEKQYPLYKDQIFGRVEHLRKLSPGWHFSENAFIKCLESELPIRNLHAINLHRNGTIKTGLWTYVASVGEVDTVRAKPIKVAFKNATDDIRKVIPLGQVSDEELARVEKEILEELELS